MSECRVIVCPPSGPGRLKAGVDDRMPGAAFSVHALTVVPQHTGPARGDELDVVAPQEGGPEVWGR
jgi:hypothetical protein